MQAGLISYFCVSIQASQSCGDTSRGRAVDSSHCRKLDPATRFVWTCKIEIYADQRRAADRFEDTSCSRRLAANDPADRCANPIGFRTAFRKTLCQRSDKVTIDVAAQYLKAGPAPLAQALPIVLDRAFLDALPTATSISFSQCGPAVGHFEAGRAAGSNQSRRRFRQINRHYLRKGGDVASGWLASRPHRRRRTDTPLATASTLLIRKDSNLECFP